MTTIIYFTQKSAPWAELSEDGSSSLHTVGQPGQELGGSTLKMVHAHGSKLVLAVGSESRFLSTWDSPGLAELPPSMAAGCQEQAFQENREEPTVGLRYLPSEVTGVRSTTVRSMPGFEGKEHWHCRSVGKASDSHYKKRMGDGRSRPIRGKCNLPQGSWARVTPPRVSIGVHSL